MKKAITFLFSVSCILALTSTQLNAQDNAYAVSVTSVNIPGSVSGTSATAPNGVSTKVYADFSKRFSNTSEEIWTTKDNITFGYFKENGVPVRVVYGKNDKMKYSIRYYTGTQVPASFTKLVKENGYEMTITNVTEVKRRFSTSSFVKMEDETSFTTIQVHPNGEISVYENYLKAN